MKKSEQRRRRQPNHPRKKREEALKVRGLRKGKLDQGVS